MKSELLYVELVPKDSIHTGPAWIGYGQFNRSRKTVYFDGKIFGKGRSPLGNFVDIVSGEYYWISGVKRNGQDRHWAGFGKISIDKNAVSEYLEIIKEDKLPKNRFDIVELQNTPNIELANKIENTKF
jgi:hypothetical protein